MNKKKVVLHLIAEQGVMPLYFYRDKEVSIEVLKALYKGGARLVEYTNRGENALENFLELRKVTDKELPGLKLGAGTIKNKIDAAEFINGGADFIVSPGMIEEVAKVAHNNGLLWVPGCMTATEIVRAEDAGAELVKLFPGNLLGPFYVAAVKEIFPDLLFMPTGGVELDEDNLSAWFKAGVAAVGLGSKVISKDVLEKKEYGLIEEAVAKALMMVKNIKLKITPSNG
ncbi:MAG TPA: bifunctional 4-hydroxy-2-oxoglutarate aldolase/2-dehydro-3-deoxy-phosphogluconate aldolase [Parafilimonas sp.]|nr:bifunctional 4-hydroxy-2-oxoglutarate aldolase/2-dehydro-3-deoxy-phosphogluconate aldolase [Parafilimonas sp.]